MSAVGSRLRPVPETPPRVLSLIRVSKERDGMVSPEVQRVAIGGYCTARGYDQVAELEGFDESGSRSRSAWWARLDQGVAMVEDGQVDVIVVWKFSRFARQRLRWEVALDRVESAGGRLESATEQVDATTSTGRFTRGMLAEINDWEARRIGEVWKEVHDRRIRAGKPATGKPKFGYVYDRTQQLHLPDPVTGPLLADLYTRYVAGESIYQLVRWLNSHGHRTLHGGAWSDRSLRRVLDSGFASGRFLAGGELHDGVHEPVIDDALWQAYLDARGLRRARPARAERSQYLLSGLVRCSRCEGSMVAGQFGSSRQPKYRCSTGKEQGPEVCTGGYVMARFVEAEVVGWLQDLAGEVDAARSMSLAAQARRTTLASEADRLARELVKVEEALQRLVLQRAESPDLPESVFAGAREDLSARHGSLSEALEEARRSTRQAVSDPAGVARGLLESWETRSVEHRRKVLRDLIARVLVTTGRPRASVVVESTWDGS